MEGGSPAQGSRSEPVELAVDARRLALAVMTVCFAAEAAFLVLDYHVNYARASEVGSVRALCNLATEDSLASWFATAQTALVALTLWLIYAAVKACEGRGWRARCWLVLAAFFTYMSVDDGAKLHERLGTAFDVLAHRGEEAGPPSWGERILDLFPSYAWQVLFLPALAALGLFLLAFLWRELGTVSARALVLLALGCFVLAVGLDFVEGLDSDHRWNLYTRIAEAVDIEDFTRYRFRHTPFDTLVHFSKAVEETLEMLGNTLLWLVFLRHGTRIASDLQVRFD